MKCPDCNRHGDVVKWRELTLFVYTAFLGLPPIVARACHVIPLFFRGRLIHVGPLPRHSSRLSVSSTPSHFSLTPSLFTSPIFTPAHLPLNYPSETRDFIVSRLEAIRDSHLFTS